VWLANSSAEPNALYPNNLITGVIQQAIRVSAGKSHEPLCRIQNLQEIFDVTFV
jgi:hypothetical protein